MKKNPKNFHWGFGPTALHDINHQILSAVVEKSNRSVFVIIIKGTAYTP